MFDLTGRRALVTGASGGIGRGIAIALASAGARVALSGTRVDALEETAHEIGAADPIILPANLKVAADVEGLVPAAEKALGGVDILVNNAGLTRDGLFMRMKDEDWDDVIAVNLTAAFRLSRAVVRSMMKQRFGRIIGISSVSGVIGNAGQGNYSASKAGLIGMTKALAREVASRNITVNTVAPGFVSTAMTEVLDEKTHKWINETVPVGRLGTVTEIAAAAVFLASNEAAYITGHTLNVNGGMAMI